jgi:lipopolysaccharide transport system permease protein
MSQGGRSLISRLLRTYLAPFLTLIDHRNLIYRLVRREITNRTSGTWLGGVWLVAQPGLQMGAFWFLLDFVLKVRSPGKVPFVEYFLTAMLTWLLVSEVLSRSLNVLSEFSPLYQRTVFPIQVLPLVPLLLAVMIYLPVMGGVVWLLAGGAEAVGSMLCLLVLGIWLIPFCYLLALLGLFFRESRQVFPFLLTLLMYLSPVLYQPEALPPVMRSLMHWNPIADWLSIIQHVVHDLPMETDQLWGLGAFWIVLLPPSWVLFRRAESQMREEL